MVSVKFAVYIHVVFITVIIFAENTTHHDDDIIMDRPELVLNSTDTQGIIYCTGRTGTNKHKNQLVASIDESITTSPTFQMKTEQVNATTIRILISPNGYIGTNRIICHWKNNVTYGERADLIIGEKPGTIKLKVCRAYDRRYVECIFSAPTIARAFRNGFSRRYNFSDLNPQQSVYRTPPVLMNITDDNELIFHFQPKELYVPSKIVYMHVDMTICLFGSSSYRFSINPLHTTKVNFRIENLSKTQLMVYINHSNTGTISQRLCSGSVSEMGNQNKLTAVQDIQKTSEQKIAIDRLHSSRNYTICLRCYYEEDDLSANEKTCQMTRTKSGTSGILYYVFIIFGFAIILTAVGIGFFVYSKNPRNSSPTDSLMSNPYRDEPDPGDGSSISGENSLGEASNEPDPESAYPRMIDVRAALNDRWNVSPDTIDLSTPHTKT